MLAKTNRSKPVISIDSSISKPLYKQIIDSVYQAIASGELGNGDLLPSVNQIAAEWSIARGSIFKAYNELRSSGVIDSIPGKGYFVTSTRGSLQLNIFMMLSTFNPYREALFNAFVGKAGNQAKVDIYFHHHNIDVFSTLIQHHATHYNCFVIMPEIHPRTETILKQLDQKKIYILDSGLKEFGNDYPGVVQNYENDIYSFLKAHAERLDKYNRMVLLFPDNIRTYGVIAGFKKFFREFKFPAKVVKNTSAFKFERSDICIAMDDKDLVRLIKAAKANHWTLGTDIGVISYNETPLKSVLAEGITTITPDFEQMGRTMAEMILDNVRRTVENPFLMIERKSF